MLTLTSVVERLFMGEITGAPLDAFSISACIVNGWIGFAIAISDFIRSEGFLLEPIAVFSQHSVNPMDGNNIRTDERIRRCSTP
jgi:hypothetical protein